MRNKFVSFSVFRLVLFFRKIHCNLQFLLKHKNQPCNHPLRFEINYSPFSPKMSASFQSVLQQVTQEKLEELKLQKNLMTAHFAPVLQQVSQEGQSGNVVNPPKAALHLLNEALKTSPVKDAIDPIVIENLKYILQNSEEDPSISSPQLIRAWIDRVCGEINYALRKCEYSYLYGSLLSEWLEVKDKDKVPSGAAAEAKEKIISSLRKLMFTPPSKEEFDGEKFRKFLVQELFSFGGENVDGGEATLVQVKKETETFFPLEDNSYFSTNDVKCCIKGLNSDELLSPEKKSALKELADNAEALEEVATLLTTRLKNLDRWEWPLNIREEASDIRRGLAGEYKAYLNEDIVTALFLQYVGVEWGAYFKRQFLKIYNSKAWKRKDCATYSSVEWYRNEMYTKAFLSALPNSLRDQENKNKEEYAKVEDVSAEDFSVMEQEDDEAEDYLGWHDLEVEAPVKLSGLRHHSKERQRYNAPPPPTVPHQDQDIDFKQQFLHVLCTEVKLNQVVRPGKSLIVVQADLESFGPSVIHEAVLIALEFLGVNKQWLSFFKRFLQPQIKLTPNDGAEIVKRGLPAAHALSNLFGETLLFLLDFLVNRKCNGLRLYRISEELWFWSPEPDEMINAWSSLQTYGGMVGLKVNENRSGSVSVFSDLGKTGIICGPEPLPQKNIHWGYLELRSNGRFYIDQKALEKFMDEMKGLLTKSDCVLQWINIFNKYFTFFIRNFGKSAVSLGKQHLDQIISALNQILNTVLSTPSDPVLSLKQQFPVLQEDPTINIVDAWIYWPLERGGLGLINPFISVLALKETYSESEKNSSSMDKDFSKLPLEDKQLWEEMKKYHEQGYGVSPSSVLRLVYETLCCCCHQAPCYQPMRVRKPPTWEEYVASRETRLVHWYQRYIHLLERPGPKCPSVSAKFHTLEWRGGGGGDGDDELGRNYFMGLFTYYETQLRGHFGDVVFINSKLLPMSMIGNIQKTKVRHD